MKYLLLVFVLFALHGFSQQGLIIEKEFIQASFNSTMTMEDLNSVKDKLHDAGIDIHYNYATFKRSGRLSSLSFVVDCKDGYKGSASQKFILRNSQFGFFRDSRENAKIYFKVGSLKKKSKKN